MKRQFKLTAKTGDVPGFHFENHTYQLLNMGLDIDAGGVTYHLSSEFAGENELGAIIDLIELERSRRNLA